MTESIDELIKAWAKHDDELLRSMRDISAPNLRPAVDAVLVTRSWRWATFTDDELATLHATLMVAVRWYAHPETFTLELVEAASNLDDEVTAELERRNT